MAGVNERSWPEDLISLVYVAVSVALNKYRDSRPVFDWSLPFPSISLPIHSLIVITFDSVLSEK